MALKKKIKKVETKVEKKVEKKTKIVGDGALVK